MKMHKKAMFFTLMSMILISLFIFALISPPKNITGIEKLDPIATRTQGLNDLVTAINKIYIPAIIKATTYQTLKDIAKPVAPLPYADFAATLDSDAALGDTRSVNYWFGQLNRSAFQAYHTTIELVNFEVQPPTQQENQPFAVTTEFDIEYIVNGMDPKLYWRIKYDSRKEKTSIINLPDPDNSNELVIPLPAPGTYFVDTLGKSYLEKISGLSETTLFESNKICPSPSEGCLTPP